MFISNLIKSLEMNKNKRKKYITVVTKTEGFLNFVYLKKSKFKILYVLYDRHIININMKLIMSITI